MKKTLSLVLVCILALTAVVAVQAEPYYIEAVGLTIEVPEGMTAQDVSTENALVIAISVDGDDNLKYAFSLNYIDEFADKDLDDLTQEEGDMLMQGIAISIPEPQFEAADADGLDLLVVSSADGSQLHYITLMGGWMLDVAVGRADGELTDDDIAAAAEILFSMEFDEE